MKAKVCQYMCPGEDYRVVVYWGYDPDVCPHDFDLYLTKKEWKKLSGGLRFPKKNENMVVDISFKEVVGAGK